MGSKQTKVHRYPVFDDVKIPVIKPNESIPPRPKEPYLARVWDKMYTNKDNQTSPLVKDVCKLRYKQSPRKLYTVVSELLGDQVLG
mmetsp:Transcript_10013/g.19028  ORF Transcript_10013/g.19028 Transcript_10013/m.19028 type:complete len:86 (-) Transcript_10013:156-413(-)